MTTKIEWIKEVQSTSMIAFDFKKFMKRYTLTVTDMAHMLYLTEPGVVAMLKRGTIKSKLLPLIKATYPDCQKYIINNKK